MNKKDLKMRPVGNEYLEQYNALLRYVFQVTDQFRGLAGEGDHPGEISNHAESGRDRLV